MTTKERLQRIEILQQQLTLTQRYPKYFLTLLGKRGLEKMVDDILDELTKLYKEI